MAQFRALVIFVVLGKNSSTAGSVISNFFIFFYGNNIVSVNVCSGISVTSSKLSGRKEVIYYLLQTVFVHLDILSSPAP